MHISDYFQFIFSMLPPDFSNQPTNSSILQKSKDRDKIYCCDICGKQFAEKKNLQRHNKSMHEGLHKEDMRYTCEECNREFS